MAGVDASGSLTPLRRESRSRVGGIVFDARRVAQPSWSWFDPAQWGDRAVPVGSGGRGSAWFVNAPFGAVVLRHYLRGGLAARVSHDRYLWQGVERTRSLAEFALLETLHGMGLPVPAPVAACYQRRGATYRASILVERIPGVVSLADRIAIDGDAAPWEQAGLLVERFHRAGVDHADLNAHNILFDRAHSGWLIDFDRGVMRPPSARWRENNLARLKRSLLKVRGARSVEQTLAGFARLHAAYEGARAAAP